MMRILLMTACLALLPLSLHAENIVCIEAESVASLTQPMRVVDCKAAATNDAVTAVKDAANDMYLDSPEMHTAPPVAEAETNNMESVELQMKGAATITVDIPADGEYYFWGRVWWHDECKNSFTASFDQKPGFTFGDDRTFKCWHWIKALKAQKLTKGKHTLELKQREPGARIDQILFVDDRRYVPVGIEESVPRK